MIRPGFFLALLAAAGASAEPGRLVIVGGALDPGNAAIYRQVLDGRLPGRPLCIVPSASARPKRSMRAYVREFVTYGGPGSAIAMPITTARRERASSARWVGRLESCGGFFFTGGDQSRIVDVFRPGGLATPADEALRRVWREGGVVAGSSAGAAMMSDPMIGGGSSADALDHGVVGRDGEPGVRVRRGMGFLEDAIVGQHHLARGRLGRLLVALGSVDATRGFGVDEDTAVVVESGTARVVGASLVAIVEEEGDDDGRRFRLTLLGDGDTLRLDTGEITPAGDKRPIDRGGAALQPPADPWDGPAFVRFAFALASSSVERAATRSGTTILQLAEGPSFRAMAREGEGPLGVPRALFAGTFVLTLSPARAVEVPR